MVEININCKFFLSENEIVNFKVNPNQVISRPLMFLRKR